MSDRSSPLHADQESGEPASGWPRRRVLKAVACAGVGSALFGRALAAVAEDQPRVTEGMIRKAEWISGIRMTDQDRKLMLEGVNESLRDYAKLRAVSLDNGVAPAIFFDAQPAGRGAAASPPPAFPAVTSMLEASARRPASQEDLAFCTLSEASALIRSRQITSVELTRLYLERLQRFDPVLHCVITVTGELALRQAEEADREIAAGRHRGPLHGIPWGAKDLLAVPGYPTTWGSVPYREQRRPETATVVEKLQRAGAVLLAKLSVGELAWGDVWFGGTTKNPWKVDQGSSGSSAGSASATAAGLMTFAIGTETWGSIVSPCTRCGVTGLRPTFGRVSRHGAMALSWSMDKIGPIARSADDCAVVFSAIHGADTGDPTSVSRPFEWPNRRDPASMRIGVVEALFEEDRTKQADTEEGRKSQRDWMENDRKALQTLRDIGFQLVPLKLPETYPVGALGIILGAEASAAFDDLTRSGRDDRMVRQVADAWPNVFRQGQLIPAVEYLRANRIRTLVMREMEELMAGVDLYVSPSYGGDNLLMTNLTGHPQVVVPDGFRSGDGTPTSITFTGRLFGEADLLAAAHAFQQATDFHRKRPPLKA